MHIRDHTTGELTTVVADEMTIPCDRSNCHFPMHVIAEGMEHRLAGSYIPEDQRGKFARLRLGSGEIWSVFDHFGIRDIPAETFESPHPHQAWLWECERGHRATTVDGVHAFHRHKNRNATTNRWGKAYWNGIDVAD